MSSLYEDELGLSVHRATVVEQKHAGAGEDKTVSAQAFPFAPSGDPLPLPILAPFF